MGRLYGQVLKSLRLLSNGEFVYKVGRRGAKGEKKTTTNNDMVSLTSCTPTTVLHTSFTLTLAVSREVLGSCYGGRSPYTYLSAGRLGGWAGEHCYTVWW